MSDKDEAVKHECSDCRKEFTETEDNCWELCESCYRGRNANNWPPAPEYCHDCDDREACGRLPAPELPWDGPFKASCDSEGFWMIHCGDGRVVIDPVIYHASEPEDVARSLAAVLNRAWDAQKGK